LACGPRTGTRARVGLGRRGGGGVRVGDERELGDDVWAPSVSGTGRGGGERLWRLAGRLAGPERLRRLRPAKLGGLRGGRRVGLQRGLGWRPAACRGWAG
jgi:hypothetical protein